MNHSLRSVLGIGLCLSIAPTLYAVIPEGYYNMLEGKKGRELQTSIKEVCQPNDFVSIEYGEGQSSVKTWQVFNTSDVCEIEGRKIWWDMYSNYIVYVESGNKSLNIEHSVANSWWGGKNGNLQAYQDLHHLNPSNSEANVKKSNLPLGITVINPAYSNGLIKVGKPAVGYGGNSTSVFEPADEYKGDFARAYMYIFSAYPDIAWLTNKGGENMYEIVAGEAKLLPWASKMLLEWSREDPVDSKEINRNEEIYKYQHNRNPFIDIPELAEYVWGNETSSEFHIPVSQNHSNDRPSAPRPLGLWMTGVNTYRGRYWEQTRIEFDTNGADLWISINGESFQRYGDAVVLPASKGHGITTELESYCEKEVNGKLLRSSMVRIKMTGKELGIKDYSVASYEPATADIKINKDDRFVLSSALSNHIMGIEGVSFMPDCWFAVMNQGEITEVPLESALLSFEPTSTAGQYLLKLYDMGGAFKGFWNAVGANKMKIDSSDGTPVSVIIREDGNADIKFTSNGSLQYNQTQPRFVNYTSVQGDVKLYRFRNFGDGLTRIGELSSDETEFGFWIENKEVKFTNGGTVYDLSGIELRGGRLASGIYIIRLPNGKTSKIYMD